MGAVEEPVEGGLVLAEDEHLEKPVVSGSRVDSLDGS